MKNERLIAYILIAVGAVTLLSRLGSADWLWMALIAAALLAGYVTRKNYGFLVAGAVMAGLAVGEMIGTLSGTLISLGAGFLAVDRVEPRPNRWPLYLAGALAGVGLFVGLGNVLNSFWVALIFIAGGAYLLLREEEAAPATSEVQPAQPQAGGSETRADAPTPESSTPGSSAQGTPAADTSAGTPTTDTSTPSSTDASDSSVPGSSVSVEKDTTTSATSDASPKEVAADKTDRPAENISPALDENELNADERERYRLLEVWRKETASSESRPAYIVLRNESLRQIAQQNPQTLSELNKVKGIGPVKLEQYGDAILSVLRGEKPPEGT